LKKEEIGKKVGKVIDHYKMGKHFTVTIGEGTFSYEEAIEEFGLEPIDRLFQAGSYLRGDGSALG
jgi:hypothetical protein